MVFSSLLFLFWFIPVFFAVYYIVPAKFRNTALFAGSIVFYAWGEPSYLILIFISIIVNYIAGILMERAERAKKAVLTGALIFDFGMLFVFKYTGFFVENINSLFGTSLRDPQFTLPLGISFYTFQIASYVIDLYRRKIKTEHNILTLGTYLVMFPQLIAGPIVVYSQVSEQLHSRKITMEGVSDGITTFLIGLSSKVLIANTVGQLWDDLEAIGYDKSLTRALYKAIQASGMNVANYGTVLATIADADKPKALPLIQRFYDLGFNIEATEGTAKYLKEHGIRTRLRHKLTKDGSDEILIALRQGHIAYVINTIDINAGDSHSDGSSIRRAAVDNNVTMFTSLDTVKVLLDVLEEITLGVSTIDAE